MFKKKKSKSRLKYFGFHSYLIHAYYHLKHAFIPHEYNDHYPRALRPHAIVTYGVFLLVLKVAVTSMLFISFPDAAKLSQEHVQEIFRLTNDARKEHNLKPLKIDPYLTSVAELKVSDMAEKMYFSHYTPEGYAPWYFIDEQRYNYLVAGENLAMNFVEMNSVQKAFMASPGHRKNILHPEYEDVGFAIARAEIDGKQTQVLVEYFGAKKMSKNSFGLFSNPPLDVAPEEKTLENQFSGTAETEDLPIISEEITRSNDSFQFSNELIVFASTIAEKTLPLQLYDAAYKLFIFFLAFIVISLFVNIIVKIKIQHGRILVQSSLLILLVVAIIITRFHFLEDLNVSLQIY